MELVIVNCGGVQEKVKSNISGVGMVVNLKVGAENRPNTFPDLQDAAPVKRRVI